MPEGSNAMIRLVVADDHWVVREGIRQVVNDEPDLELAGEASNAEELLGLVRTHPCDLVVLDISMPGRSGLDVLRDLKRDYPDLLVLVFSMHPEVQYVAQAFRAGAAGYLTKEGVGEEFLAAIRKVIDGGRYISPGLAETLALRAFDNTSRPPHERLSDQERHVMCRIAAGASTKEIASELSRSVRAIDACRARILKKMNMENIGQVIRYVVEHGLTG
jgi:two-component system, NarL family, invasion response regulator UvrY